MRSKIFKGQKHPSKLRENSSYGGSSCRGFFRCGKKNRYGSGPLIFENAYAHAGNIFLLQIFYQLTYKFIIERQGM